MSRLLQIKIAFSFEHTHTHTKHNAHSSLHLCVSFLFSAINSIFVRFYFCLNIFLYHSIVCINVFVRFFLPCTCTLSSVGLFFLLAGVLDLLDQIKLKKINFILLRNSIKHNSTNFFVVSSFSSLIYMSSVCASAWKNNKHKNKSNAFHFACIFHSHFITIKL